MELNHYFMIFVCLKLTKSMIGADVHSIFMDWLQAEDFVVRASIWPVGAS